MAARKLQAEMDRTFKKIQEGVENFEDIESKMNAAGSAAQKEKLEADLKTQIKKLQRLRDQLKTWQQGSDVKDKAPIIEHRRLIEVQMERFKAIEKEMKTKAYSTVGLISHSKLDPREQQRLDLVQWLQGKVEELQQQVETSEAELETLQAGTKKKGKAAESGQARQTTLETLNEHRNWHISQLEIILRLVENASLKVDDVEAVKEDVDFFVTQNSDEDFEYDDGVYAELNLDDYVEADAENESTIASDDDVDDLPPPRISARRSQKLEEDDLREDLSSKKITPARPRARSAAKGTEAAAVAASPKVILLPPSANFAQQSMASAVKSGGGAPPARVVPTLPPLRYAAAAAGATSAAGLPSATSAVPPTPALSTAVPRAPTSPLVSLAPSITANTSTNTLSSLEQNTPASTDTADTPASDHPAPISPSEQAVSSVVASPVLSLAATREREPSVSVSSNLGAHGQTGSFGGAPSAPSVTSMSLASPVVSLVEAPGASPQVPKMSNSILAYSSESAQPASNHQQSNYTLQSILPPQNTLAPPPGLAVNGLREISNASAATVKPDPAAIQRPGMRVAPEDELAVNSNLGVNNNAGAIGAAYGAPHSPSGVSTNGRDEAAQQSQGGQQAPKFAATLSDLMSSFKTAGLKASDRMKDSEQVKDVLDVMSPTMPQPRDAERPKYHTTRNPMQTPAYYPQQILPLLSTPVLFERLDVETLFWVFYYMPGTYQQWLAAQELKKQSWRFHVKFLTWFQRHAKPDEVTDEYEQGQYLYFDWEGSWCVRKKSDFRFEYRNLSDD